MTHYYLEDRLLCAAEHLRSAMEHLRQGEQIEPGAYARFVERLNDAGLTRLQTLIDECELVAAVLGSRAFADAAE